MKVLFLDIDGVLNRDGTKERCGQFVGVDRALSAKLLKWLRSTDVKIVLSSTWRNHPDMHPHLNDAGIHWDGMTPQHPIGPRGFQIKAWLDANPAVTAFAILDDMQDMLPDQMARLVQTDTRFGLQDSHIDQLMGMFQCVTS